MRAPPIHVPGELSWVHRYDDMCTRFAGRGCSDFYLSSGTLSLIIHLLVHYDASVYAPM